MLSAILAVAGVALVVLSRSSRVALPRRVGPALLVGAVLCFSLSALDRAEDGAAFLQHTMLGLSAGCLYAIAAAGLVLIYSTTGIFNFAHGALGMVSAFAYWQLTEEMDVPVPLAVVLVLGVLGPVLGVLLELLLRRFRPIPTVTAELGTAIVLTIAVAVLCVGATSYLFEPTEAHELPFLFGSRTVTIGGATIGWHDVLQIVLAALTAVGLRVLLHGSRTGAAMRAVADDPGLAVRSGARPTVVGRVSWILGTELAVVAGLLVAGGTDLDPITLTFFVVGAIGAAVFGRLRSLPLAFAGAILLGIIRGWSAFWLPRESIGIGLGSFDVYVVDFRRIEASIPALFLFVTMLVLPRARLTVGRLVSRSVPRVPSLPSSVLRGVVFVGAVALLAPLVPDHRLADVSTGLGYGIILLSVVLLTGYSGQVSLAQFVFVALGAVTMGKTAGGDSIVGMAAAGLIAVPIGAIVALPALRLQGIYLALITFGFASVSRELLFQDPHLLGDDPVEVGRLDLFGVSFAEDRSYLVLCAGAFAAVGVAVLAVRRGAFGRRLAAMRDSEAACALLGLDLRRTKLAVFCASAFIAGLAGALVGGVGSTVSDTTFDPIDNIVLLLFAVVGGITTVSGALLGGALFALLPLVRSEQPDLAGLVIAAVAAIALVLRRRPDGLAGIVVAALDPRGRPAPDRDPNPIELEDQRYGNRPTGPRERGVTARPTRAVDRGSGSRPHQRALVAHTSPDARTHRTRGPTVRNARHWSSRTWGGRARPDTNSSSEDEAEAWRASPGAELSSPAMSRRIEIELTSAGDGSWTWRAAGAQKPRGVVESTLVPDGAKVGDVLRAETENDIEGVTILSLSSTQARNRTEPERIEVVGSSRRDDDQLVTTQLVSKSRGDRDRRPRRDGDRPRSDRPDGDRRPRGDRPEGERRPRSDRPEGDRRPRRDGDRPQSTERRGPRKPAPPPLPERPKPKRLRPGRVHRKAILADLPAEQQPIAEEVLRGGIPAVRQAIETENEKRAAGGEPPINSPELLKLAESLLPRLRTAEWRDRADAALADADHLDLRDLRSVVVASDAAARDDETREMAGQLRVKLDERVVAEQALWLEDLHLALDAGRIVRALRVSSRPPKAGTMLSPDLRLALTGGANAALAADAGPDRWAAVLDAIAYSPVRTEVAPVSTPESPSDELLAVVRKYASRVPKVAVAFGIDAQPAKRPSGRALRPPKPPRRSGAVPVPERSPEGALGAPVATDAPVTEAATTDTPATEPAVTDTPATDAATTEPAVTDTPATEPAVTEAATTDTPATEPAVTDTPATDAAAPEPAVTDTPATDTPATEPAAEVRDAYEDEPAADVIEAAIEEVTEEAAAEVTEEATAEEAPSEG